LPCVLALPFSLPVPFCFIKFDFSEGFIKTYPVDSRQPIVKIFRLNPQRQASNWGFCRLEGEMSTENDEKNKQMMLELLKKS
jgi:hypothetical protein